MLEVHNNLLATPRMLVVLERDRHFRVEDSDNLDAEIPYFAWVLLARARGKSGEMEILKGPYYQHTFVRIRDIENQPRAYLFRIAERLVCVTFSKDWEFDPNTQYVIDESKGNFYVYPKFIDDVEMPR
jgi:hypothetical protein